ETDGPGKRVRPGGRRSDGGSGEGFHLDEDGGPGSEAEPGPEDLEPAGSAWVTQAGAERERPPAPGRGRRAGAGRGRPRERRGTGGRGLGRRHGARASRPVRGGRRR